MVDGLWERVADRIHVATALTVRAEEFLSVDGRLARRVGKSDVRGQDNIPVCYKSLTGPVSSE
jgi:hypothetical protein